MGKYTGKEKPKYLDDLIPEKTTHTHTPTHTTPMKERKTRRVQLLMKESTVEALDRYASRNDIIQKLVEDFIEKNV